jgi:hypothetical protein
MPLKHTTQSGRSEMKLNKASTAVRFFFLFVSTVIWLGIWETGFSTAHWLLYVPAIFLSFAAITGICPGLIVANLLFPARKDALH